VLMARLQTQRPGALPGLCHRREKGSLEVQSERELDLAVGTDADRRADR
jgi:hypothetical protein